ncbi:hypothetical protein E0493_14260 [Roseomonas sp. M0104]|uniref:Uncharacterized protein n=1 Tax=Teichococcus coralli TaxID=2545983 RepID=A0A845BBH4_9PROT|nr:hypothetical protein [Pseudoroseomonas coralli]MXP64511.1 hypothetical protein [Pseudoroseomonas coralli]
MLYIAPFILLQCLGALVAWALIARRGISGAILAEAGAVWLAPLLVAGAFGLTADTVVRIASCGIVFNLVNWLWQGLPQRSE